jgi:hypothetical protein
MAKATYLVAIEWETNRYDSRLKDFVIYGVRAGSNDMYVKGQQLAVVDGKERSAEVELEEGNWVIRVIPRNHDGTEAPLGIDVPVLRTRVDSSGLPDAPSTPVNASVGPSEPVGATAAVDPVDGSDPTEAIQVIEGPDEYRGKLVAELPAFEGAADGGNRARMSVLGQAAIMGYGVGVDRTLNVRGMARGHAPGSAATAITMKMPALDDAFSVEIASLIATGSGVTLENWTTPASTDPVESDNNDGWRARAIPTRSAAGTEWEDKVGGLLEDVPTLACYLNDFEIETQEVDLGHTHRGVLDINDEWQRKSSAFPDGRHGYFTLPKYPDEETALAGTQEKDHHEWAARFIRRDGKPCQPLRHVQWWAKWDTVTPITNAYVPYRPGMWVFDARYIRLKCHVLDPSGLYQLMMPRMDAYLHVKYQRQFGSTQCDASTATKTVNLSNDAIMTASTSPFQNRMMVIVTPTVSGKVLSVTAKSATANPPTFTVTHVDMTGATPSTATPFDWMVIGY